MMQSWKLGVLQKLLFRLTEVLKLTPFHSASQENIPALGWERYCTKNCSLIGVLLLGFPFLFATKQLALTSKLRVAKSDAVITPKSTPRDVEAKAFSMAKSTASTTDPQTHRRTETHADTRRHTQTKMTLTLTLTLTDRHTHTHRHTLTHTHTGAHTHTHTPKKTKQRACKGHTPLEFACTPAPARPRTRTHTHRDTHRQTDTEKQLPFVALLLSRDLPSGLCRVGGFGSGEMLRHDMG